MGERSTESDQEVPMKNEEDSPEYEAGRGVDLPNQRW